MDSILAKDGLSLCPKKVISGAVYYTYMIIGKIVKVRLGISLQATE